MKYKTIFSNSIFQNYIWVNNGVSIVSYKDPQIFLSYGTKEILRMKWDLPSASEQPIISTIFVSRGKHGS